MWQRRLPFFVGLAAIAVGPLATQGFGVPSRWWLHGWRGPDSGKEQVCVGTFTEVTAEGLRSPAHIPAIETPFSLPVLDRTATGPHDVLRLVRTACRPNLRIEGELTCGTVGGWMPIPIAGVDLCTQDPFSASSVPFGLARPPGPQTTVPPRLSPPPPPTPPHATVPVSP